MQKRKFDELISHFNRKVSDMSIDQKYKMELLGMISAIGFAHEKELGTNLAEVGTDCISRQVAIDVLEEQIAYCDKALKTFGISMKDEYAVKVEKASLVAYKEQLEAIPAVQPEPLTDKEQRIFLAAMERERKVCKEVDDQYVHEPYEVLLTKVCDEIKRKVKKVLWT